MGLNSERTSVKIFRIEVLPVADKPNNMKPCRTYDVSKTWMILLVKLAVFTNSALFLMMTGIRLSTYLWSTFPPLVYCLGKISLSKPSNNSISSKTSFDIFIFLRDLINKNSSKNSFFYGVKVWSGFIYFLFVFPAVLKTDKIFRKPKS